MIDWRKSTIAQALRLAADQRGEIEALAWSGGRFTYREMYGQACRLAHGLEEIGVKRGDHVATLFGAGPEWVFLKYALHILGAVIVPVNVNFKADELKYILGQAEVSTYITVDELRFGNYPDLLAEIDPGISAGEAVISSRILPHLKRVVVFNSGSKTRPLAHDFKKVAESGAGYDPAAIDALVDEGRPSDPCNILFTSGSTAFPKGAVHVHTSLLGIAEHLVGRTFDVASHHRLLNYLPFYHIAGCVYFPLGALMRGCSMYVSEFIPDEILRIIEEEKISLYGGFDAHFNALRSHPRFGEADLSSITRVLLAVGPEWYEKIEAMFPQAEIIAHHYGFSEGTGVSQMPDQTDRRIRKYYNGRAWPGIEVKVVDPAGGETRPAGEPGEICLRGWSRFQEYYNNPEETAKAIDADGFFHSGDYGWMDEQGNLAYRGRYKMMIKTGGENVSEREVEMFLEGLAGVEAVQVLGLPDDQWGEMVTAVIQPAAGVELTREDVLEYCRDKIARFKIPKYILFIGPGEWPLLGAGKVDKLRLREMAAEKVG